MFVKHHCVSWEESEPAEERGRSVKEKMDSNMNVMWICVSVYINVTQLCCLLVHLC
jgi:hypothetical protein